MSGSEKTAHQTLLDQVIWAIYANSTAAVFFHAAVAAEVGLGATEEKALLILSAGPLTAGEIAQKTGLTTPSVTNLVDRLERKGFVQRVRDTQDRRRVIVELKQDRFAELTSVFARLHGPFDTLLEGYTDEDLTTILQFLTRMTSLSQDVMTTLNLKEA